ncbi:MAG TPA: NYN domain-containing protein [Actinomycetota bacterium]|nr:NYN domain-containing protein [Actinomycetota bacterium]
MNSDEERIALFLDFENLALGARDRGGKLDLAVIMEALSERGRVVIRRAYADWNLFSEHRQNVVGQRIEMIEIPQRTGMVRKNAADIKLAVDALELAFEREFLSTFVIGSGDSDFTPLVLKLRELNRRVIGIGVEGSTSDLLPGACDEFLFYERLAGPGTGRATGRRRKAAKEDTAAPDRDDDDEAVTDLHELSRLITRTVAGLQRSMDGPVLSSMLKRAILRKDPTFSEGDYGFRAWGELTRHLETMGVVELREGSAAGDPVVDFPTDGGNEEQAFELLRDVVAELEQRTGAPPLSGLKNELRRRQPNFSEKDFGYGGFLQFVKAAVAKGIVDLEWEDENEDYFLSAGGV